MGDQERGGRFVRPNLLQFLVHLSSGNSPKISITKLVKEFDGKTVLKDISLNVDAGQSLCIIGTSGCGKSVTLKCLLGLITPSGVPSR